MCKISNNIKCININKFKALLPFRWRSTVCAAQSTKYISSNDVIVMHVGCSTITMFSQEARFTFYYFNICHDKFLLNTRRVLQITTACFTSGFADVIVPCEILCQAELETSLGKDWSLLFIDGATVYVLKSPWSCTSRVKFKT